LEAAASRLQRYNDHMDRKTRIVATIGPASQDTQIIERMIGAGMNVARLNFSHGTQAGHLERLTLVREAAASLGVHVALLQDLQGPKIRVGTLPPQGLSLAEGERVALYIQGDEPPTASKSFPVDFLELFHAVTTGSRILLDDGRISLIVAGVAVRSCSARVEVGGVLLSHKGINLPDSRLDIPGFTEKDAHDLAFGMENGVEAVAVSFVRSERDIEQVRAEMDRLAPNRSHPLVVAKLERPEALLNLDKIVALADGLMVARGDLGVELPPEEVPTAQKEIIRAANQAGKLVITATQMLDSMVAGPTPTRAEASDVANAVFDGTDALMLSAETAVGRYPAESVAMMDKIARKAEQEMDVWGRRSDLVPASHSDALAIALAARELAQDMDVAGICVFTRSGRSAEWISRVRPRVPILAFSPDENTCRRMALLWGVTPRWIPYAATLDQMLEQIGQAIHSTGSFQPGQQVVLVCAFPVGEMLPPNMLLLQTVE